MVIEQLLAMGYFITIVQRSDSVIEIQAETFSSVTTGEGLCLGEAFNHLTSKLEITFH